MAPRKNKKTKKDAKSAQDVSNQKAVSFVENMNSDSNDEENACEYIKN